MSAVSNGGAQSSVDVIVIGGGLNGLVAAALIAMEKLSVVLVEPRPEVGGAAITAEISPGFHAPVLSHSLGPVSEQVVRALRLNRVEGLTFLRPNPALTTIDGNGRSIVFHPDAVLTAGSINAHSPADAGRWPDFARTARRLGDVLERVAGAPAPPLDDVRARDVLPLLGAGRAARKLGRRDLARLARYLSMPIGDVASEWFENDLVKAAVAAHAIAGNPVGPRSAGTGAMWLQRLAADRLPVGSGVSARGGPGALTSAVARAASAAGVGVRNGVRVVRILTGERRANGVALDNGDEVRARAVVAAIGPKVALGDLCDPSALPPTVRDRVRHIRARGVTAKINLALSALPSFPALTGDPVTLGGRVLIAPGLDYLERAFDAVKYGAMSESPWLEISLPSVSDDTLAPPGAHVMSVYAHFAPRHLRDASWELSRDRLWSNVLRVLDAHAPGIGQLIVARQLLTPEDLEASWGLPGGHIFHAETTLDQSWVARPVLGWAGSRAPIEGLYLASAGAHPGGGLTGLPGWLASRAVTKDLKRRKRSTEPGP